MMRKNLVRSISVTSFLLFMGCGAAGGGDPVGDGMTGGTDDGDPDGSSGTSDGGPGGGVGPGPDCDPPEMVECKLNEDCDTGYCRSYSNAPPDPEAACEEPPPDGELAVLATVREFSTLEVVEGAEVKVTGALDASQNPATAPAIAMATSGADGRITTSTTEADGKAIGIVAVTSDEGAYRTASGLVEADLATGSYPPGIDNHDIWVVYEDQLETWSGLLEDDSEAAPFLPLGEQGGVVGRIQDSDCGQGMAGVKVVPQYGDSSQAIIRYLDEGGGSFSSEQTGPSGIFVIVNPGLAEKFDAHIDGENVGEREATVGSTANGIFAVTIIIAEE